MMCTWLGNIRIPGRDVEASAGSACLVRCERANQGPTVSTETLGLSSGIGFNTAFHVKLLLAHLLNQWVRGSLYEPEPDR